MAENGVEFYAIGRLTAPVPFFDGYADCRHCPTCVSDRDFNLYRCKLAQEFPMLGLQFTIRGGELDRRHEQCPLDLDDLPF